MKTLKTLSAATAIAVALGGATIAPAAAATYAGSRQVGANGSMSLSLVTDDTLGVLTEDNVLDWTISFSNGTVSDTLFGPLSGGHSVIRLKGTTLTASSTDLVFDFDGAGILLFATAFNPDQHAYCIGGKLSFLFRCNGTALEGVEDILLGPENSDRVHSVVTGQVVLGTVVDGPPPTSIPGSVPEPTTWALMIAGFGMAGAQLRRRRVMAA